ncbi:hypothetical protein AALO_G00238410 [Alosa alosa]|uniref:Collagen alpha-1(XVI) chain n=2 Tax=Alosa alosa TaxID=278164 RepID=A0AAV6G0X9_9TELE|nr:hypothetical protein AALO_G00238410 [Alosa alosa]
MTNLLKWTVFLWIVNTIPLSCGMAVNERIDHSCPPLKLEESRFASSMTETHEFTGFDLAEKFLLRKVVEDRAMFRLGSKPLIKPTELVFPNGLPSEFSIVATFRLRKTTKKDRWYLWQIFDQSGTSQVSIVVDGAKKVVEFSSLGLLKNSLHHTFKSRDLHALFDRQWHTLGVAVQTSIVSIFLDCKLIERRQLDERDSTDMRGRTLITTRVEDGRPVDIELQQILIFCDPQLAEMVNCCEAPGSTCSPKEVPAVTRPPTVTGYLPRMLSQPMLQSGDKCQCSAEKGDPGLPGLAGLPGQKGDKGDRGETGEDGYPGNPGMKGDKGSQGFPGLDGLPGSKGEVGSDGAKGSVGEKGEKGDFGERGNDGIPGINGLKGDPGAAGAPGLKGEKGDIGPPGPAASLTEMRGLKGDQGLPGPAGEKGETGVSGQPGTPGKEGKRGRRGKPGDPGKPGPPGPAGSGEGADTKGDKGDSGASGEPGVKGEKGDAGQPGEVGAGGIKGEKGEAGPRGPPGPVMTAHGLRHLAGPGEEGEKGQKGEKGDQGERGIQGPQGLKGSMGLPGPQGLLGPEGKEGPAGTVGLPGVPGEVGSPGEPGERGKEGPKGEKVV